VLLVNVSFIVPFDPVPVRGVMFGTLALLHTKVVPAVAEVPIYDTNPEQAAVIVFVEFNFGLGFTVTTTVSGLEHPFALNVKIYRTTIGDVVLFLSVSVIIFPAPGVAVVVIFVTAGRFHVNTVPAVPLVAV
jgi:hypothetical protein